MKSKTSISALIIFLITLPAFGGGISGGGGKAIVCRNLFGEIKSAELLDLYEGSVEQGYKYPKSNLSSEIQLRASFNKMNAGNSQLPVNKMADKVEKMLRFIPDGTKLDPTDDSYEVVAPRNCEIEQLANFQNDQKIILVDHAIWSKLSETNQAALIAHETVYWIMRVLGDKNSTKSRQVVAYAFSDGTFESWQAGIPTDAWECLSQDHDGMLGKWPRFLFLAYNNAFGALTFQFEVIDSLMFNRTVISFEQFKTSMADTYKLSQAMPFAFELPTQTRLPHQAIAIQFTTPKDDVTTITGLIGLDNTGYDDVPTLPFECKPQPSFAGPL